MLIPRRYRGLIVRGLQILAIICILQSCIDILATPPTKSKVVNTRPDNNKKEKVFIASIHWNNERILRSHWTSAVKALTDHLGAENVYVSVQESGSWDNSKDALRQLDRMLAENNVPRTIILDDTTHKDEINKSPSKTGWIETPRGRTELRRIPYLARLRNLVLEPLDRLAEQGHYFDKILFLNDVIFTNEDVEELLNTQDGNYAAACSLDFSSPPKFYDTFALRDSDGHDALIQTWPYFRSRASRKAIKAGRPAPVQSCWNGIVAMDAAPFYDTLRFRGIPDSLAEFHLEGSECCLIHADNPLTSSKGVWLNPNVRVGYNPAAYEIVNPSAGQSWVSRAEMLRGSWENRIRRWFTSHYPKESVVWRRVRQWMRFDSGNVEKGTSCLINEMQVLVENGWAHV